jgi:sporulation protein YlmC with PRC-barrel domain
MLFSEALGRSVVRTDTASTVGRVSDYVVDPRLRGSSR